jgi:AraC-like DNA-binding protein
MRAAGLSFQATPLGFAIAMYDLPGAYLKDLVELAGRWNVQPTELLRGLPLTQKDLSNPATRVPLRVCEAIVARAHAMTREPALAVHVGTQMRLSSHGFLGFAAMTASTVHEAIDLACRFASTRTSALGLALYVEGDTAAITIEERTPLGEIRDFVIIALVVGLWRLGESLTGRVLDGVVECAFPEPTYVKAFPHAGRLRFNCPNNRLVFPAAELALPLKTADPVALELAREQCERELAQIVDAGLPARVRGVLAAKGDAPPSLVDIAKDLRMSPRTLKRKLAEHDTTFTQIRDDLRRHRALLLLDNRQLTISDIAAKLGYSELPNFTRAFRKWTGQTPLAYRERGR